MTLDPAASYLLEQMAAHDAPKMNTLTPEQARLGADMSEMAGEPEEVGKVENRTISGSTGEISIRIYTPEGDGPFPALVYYHGGGWVIGDLDMMDVPCRIITNRANCVVVSVDYSLAPEHKFPVAVGEAYDAVNWVAENGSLINVDSTLIAVGGDSAGGNIAAAVTLMAKDKGAPSIQYQLLIYPATNYAFDTVSYEENGKGNYFLSKEELMWFWNHYLANAEDGENPYASPLRAKDFSGLPSALVITAEYDALRDEGEAYAEKLKKAGVSVELTRYDGMIHGFFGMPLALQQGKLAIEQSAESLKQAFSVMNISSEK